MKTFYSILLIAAFVAGVASCRHDNGTTPAPDPVDTTATGGGAGGGTGGGTGGGGTGGGTGGGGTTGPDTSLCFERDILPIFISNCAKSGCHDAASHQDGFVFTSYATITSREFEPGDLGDTELWEKINENDPDDIMPPPPNSPLTAAQKALIRSWILRGAPNSNGCATNGCDTNQFTYSGTIRPMLQQYCVGCHSTASPSFGIALDNHPGVQTVALNGRLLTAITHTGSYPMPKGGAKLADCQIAQVRKWVAAGAPNN